MRRTTTIILMGTVLMCAVLALSFPAAGQEYPRWTGFPPMYSINGIVEFRGDVFCTTAGGMFRYDPETREYSLYYKNHGLVSNDVLCIGATSEAIFVGFKEDGLWRFDPDTEHFERILFPEYHVKSSANPNGIAVRDIFALDDSVLYIGHEKGVDRLNLKSEELRTYTNLGENISQDTPVNEVRVHDGRIWVATPLGLSVADEDNPNLEFAENWTGYQYIVRDIIYGITSVLHVDRPSPAVYLATNLAGMYQLDEEAGVIVPAASDRVAFTDLVEGIDTYWGATPIGLYRKQVNLWSTASAEYEHLTVLAPGTGGRLWVGTELDGLQCYTADGYIEVPPPNQMRSMTFYDIDLDSNNVLWAATTYRDSNLRSVFQRLQDGEWSAYTLDDWSLSNLVVGTMVDSRDRVWAAMWGVKTSGAYVIYDDGTPFKGDDRILPVDETKEIIRPTLSRQYIVVSDFAEDDDGNIWAANFQLDTPDHTIEPEPTSGAVVIDDFPITRHQSFSPAHDGLPTAIIYGICPDNEGWVWLATHNKGVTGLYVGDDPFDKSDLEIRELKLEQGIHSLRINALSCDQNGHIWVGTQGGLNRIVKEPGMNILVEDMNDLLAGVDREVRSIEVDPYGNKWIGTSGGLLKLSADNEPVSSFTVDNSGLFSGAILSLKYDPSGDVLWVGTNAGLNRYDVFGEEVSEVERMVRVYPNPFEIWGYDSRAVFPNLKPGSRLKIYTFGGILVNDLETVDDGSGTASAEWDGRNFQGNHVGSGVYFFLGVDVDGVTLRDKMAVIRR